MQPLHPDQELDLSVLRHRLDIAFAERRRGMREQSPASPRSEESRRRLRGLFGARPHHRAVGLVEARTQP